MKMHHNRSAWLAWMLCGVITLVVLVVFVLDLANRSSAASPVAFGSQVIWTLLPIVLAFLAALVLSRQPGNVIGWLLLLPALEFAIPAESYIKGFSSAPAVPPVSLLLALWFNGWGWLLLIFPLLYIMLLFPTGRPPSPRWRWLIVFGLGMCLIFLFYATFPSVYPSIDLTWTISNPIGFLPETAFPYIPWIIGMIALTVMCVVSLFVRYRRAGALEREQIKWLLYACGVFLIIYLLGGIWIGDLPGIVHDIWNGLFGLSLLAMPVGIAIAVLRYRLWDIDILIRRTLVYSILTVSLGLSYFVGVTLLQGAAQAVTHQRSPVSIVVITLAIAALFAPLRRRIQDFIDRRFYRRKYDAEKALAAFAATARRETNLDVLTKSVVDTVQSTLQPERTAVWLNHAVENKTTHSRESLYEAR